MERHEGAADGPVAAAATDGIARMLERRAAKPFKTFTVAVEQMSGAGTTWLIRRMRASMTDTPFSETMMTTVGFDYAMFLFPARPLSTAPRGSLTRRALGIPDDYAHPDMPPKPLLLTMTEAGGQARFQELRRSHMHSQADTFLLVYSVVWRESFVELQARLRLVRDTPTRARIMLVGTQSDRDPDPDTPDGRVSREEAEAWAEAEGLLFLGEVSAATGDGVDAALERMAQEGGRIFGLKLTGRPAHVTCSDLRRMGLVGPRAADRRATERPRRRCTVQ